MFTHATRLASAFFAVGVFLLGAPAANAQKIVGINANPQIAPGVSLQQYAYNTAVLGRAYSQIPPYLLGYNPYPLAVNYGPVYNPQTFRPSVYNPLSPQMYGTAVPQGVPYAGGYSPGGGGSPYAGGYGTGGLDPFTGMPMGGGYNSFNNPFFWNPWAGGYNFGNAMELQAYGQLGLNQEQARLLREQANQAKLDTRKKYVDTLAYIRANEYTFSQEQADIAKRLLDRVQKTPQPGEIDSGKSLNIMLDDLIKLNYQQVRVPTITLDEEILKMVNVAGTGSSGNTGLLRDDGRFTWPGVFDDRNVAAEKERKDIESQAQTLFVQAKIGKLDQNLVKDLETGLKNLRASLGKQVNVVSSRTFLDGQRFLDDFDAAVIGLKKGDVLLNLEFQQRIKGGKTVRELVEYMGSRGLRFASVCPGDERAYAALQAAFAAQSIAIQGQFAAAGKG